MNFFLLVEEMPTLFPLCQQRFRISVLTAVLSFIVATALGGALVLISQDGIAQRTSYVVPPLSNNSSHASIGTQAHSLSFFTLSLSADGPSKTVLATSSSMSKLIGDSFALYGRYIKPSTLKDNKIESSFKPFSLAAAALNGPAEFWVKNHFYNKWFASTCWEMHVDTVSLHQLLLEGKTYVAPGYTISKDSLHQLPINTLVINSKGVILYGSFQVLFPKLSNSLARFTSAYNPYECSSIASLFSFVTKVTDDSPSYLTKIDSSSAVLDSSLYPKRNFVGWKSKTGNVGDEVQILAGLQYLPRVDYYVDRDEMYKAPKDRKFFAIMNAWLARGLEHGNWPPPKNFDCYWVSSHFESGLKKAKV
ncbi:hypothetical protein GEMRC1_010679 [Eukaryota sp. GEM-RC1]